MKTNQMSSLSGPELCIRRPCPGDCIILFYSKMWNVGDDVSLLPSRVHFFLTDDRKYIDEADVVIFHMPTVEKEDKILRSHRKRAGQLWTFWSMECEVNHPWQYEPEIMGLFDITATYKMYSDIPVPYFGPAGLELLYKKPVAKTEFMNAFISSNINKSARVEYLKELMSYVEVHSYGSLFNNRALKDDQGDISKNHTIAAYKFSIAFENAIAEDYVTEKFFQPLIMGSVPVYLGAPNIDEFAPADHCYINVNDFPSAKALADYLIQLDKDEVRYQAYLDWKERPFRDKFNYKVDAVQQDPLTRLYDLLEKKLSF